MSPAFPWKECRPSWPTSAFINRWPISRGQMQKYWHVIKIGFANTLVYRFNFFFRGVFSLIPLLATIYLWRTIYRDQTGPVAGYSLAGMISYYLMVTIVDTLRSEERR